MSDKKDKGVVEFGADSDYLAKIQGVKSARVPVGGVPLPQMPRLDQPPQQAVPQVDMHRTLTPEQQAQLASQSRFVPGVGSAYAANQPGAGNIPPNAVQVQPAQQPQGVSPRPEGSGLRPETVSQLEAVAKANQTKEEDLDEGLRKDVEEISELEEQWETDEFGNQVRSLLNNQPRRNAIESRCEPMALEDLILRGEVRQRVPVVPQKFEPTFRSVAGDEDLFIKRKMSSVRGSDQYIMDRFSILNLTAGLYALNNSVLPSHLDKDGNVDEKAFEDKLKVVGRMALPVLADLSVNYVWFQRRLQKLFVIDEVKTF